MKFAIVMPLGEQRGGGELMLYDLVREGRGLDHEWLVLFLEDGPLADDVRALGVEVRIVPSGRLRQPHLFTRTVARLARIARREQVDVFVGWMWKAHLYAGPAALVSRTPSIWFQLGDASVGRHALERIAGVIPADGVITLSTRAQRAQASLRPRRRTPLVYPGVALDRFDPAAMPNPSVLRRDLGLPVRGPVIGIVGRMQRWKGVHVLVEAMPRVLRDHPGATCVIVGGHHDLEPDYGRLVQSRIEQLGLRDRCVVTGFQTNVPEWMQAMDVVVHASDREPFGIVVIEAMALGKPVVAGDEGGPTEIITHGKNGLLTPYGDADALARGILRYLDDPGFAAEIGAAASRRASDFSTRRYAQNFISALESCLHTR